MGADNIDKTRIDSRPSDAEPSIRGSDPGPRRDEGTPATDLDLRQIQGIEPIHHEATKDETSPETTPDDNRRAGAAAFAREGAAYREVDRILDGDHHQGWAGDAEASLEKAGQEYATGQRENARANQAERFSLENDSLPLLRQAQQLEKAGDVAGAAALRNEADAKMADASRHFDTAMDHLNKAQAMEARLSDSWNGKWASAQCENLATVIENMPDEVGGIYLGPGKDVAAASLRVVGHALEVYGPQGLREILGYSD